jgi:hypothetical protein
MQSSFQFMYNFPMTLNRQEVNGLIFAVEGINNGFQLDSHAKNCTRIQIFGFHSGDIDSNIHANHV